MRFVYSILSLLPVAFLFVYYEYQQHLEQSSITWLYACWWGYIFFMGVFAAYVKKKTVLLTQIVSGVISVVCGMFFLEQNTYWFTPFGRDIYIGIVVAITCLGQLCIRTVMPFKVKPEQVVKKKQINNKKKKQPSKK